MGLIGFIVIIIILGVLFDDKLGTTMATGGLQLLFGIGLTVVCFAINPILGIIIGLIYFKGWTYSRIWTCCYSYRVIKY